MEKQVEELRKRHVDLDSCWDLESLKGDRKMRRMLRKD